MCNFVLVFEYTVWIASAMAENGGSSAEEIVENEEEKYNYYECK